MSPPEPRSFDAFAWVQENKDFVDEQLTREGAVLFREFPLETIAQFERFMRILCGDLIEYTYRSTPRSEVRGRIYTSTEYPAHQVIPFHNEMSYTNSWPMRIAFFCVHAPARGGETPTADSRKIFRLIRPAIRDEFLQRRVMYTRNYGSGLDLTWQQVFGTDSKDKVAAICAKSGIDHEWAADGRLRTRQVCQATAAHPKTGETVWFNQAHLFHISALPPEIREMLSAELDEADWPRNAYFGDGEPIPSAMLDEIRSIYSQNSISFRWRPRDVLLLDNMLMAHGRNSFAGTRKIVVGMAQPHRA
jgi:alpha-ketoglutarate-dependent taurine dioxygenase